VRRFTATYKNKKFQHGAFLLSTLVPHRTELSNVFQAVCFDFAQVKASAKLCINMLSDAAVKSELKLLAKSLIVNWGNLDWFGSFVCVKCHGVVEGRKIGKLIIAIHKEAGVNAQLPGISAQPPRKSACQVR